MTPELWTLLGVIVLQLANMYNTYKTNKTNAPLTNAQAESAMGDALEKLGQAYDRALETIRVQDEELALLRPMTLKIAVQEQAMTQTQKDKDDWKKYAEKLRLQLEEHEILPIPFRRYPTNGDSQKIRTVTKEEIKAAEEKKDK